MLTQYIIIIIKKRLVIPLPEGKGKCFFLLKNSKKDAFLKVLNAVMVSVEIKSASHNQFHLRDVSTGNHDSCIHHLELDIFFCECNYHYSPHARFYKGVGNLAHYLDSSVLWNQRCIYIGNHPSSCYPGCTWHHFHMVRGRTCFLQILNSWSLNKFALVGEISIVSIGCRSAQNSFKSC